MKTYAGQIVCIKCKTLLVLENEDVKYQMGSIYRDLRAIGGDVSNTSVKSFCTICVVCKNINSLGSDDISVVARKEAQKYE